MSSSSFSSFSSDCYYCFRLVNCSRWAEVTDAIKFHAGLAEAVGVPTEFRLLNGAPPLILGRGTDDGTSHKTLLEYMERSPGEIFILIKFKLIKLILNPSYCIK